MVWHAVHGREGNVIALIEPNDVSLGRGAHIQSSRSGLAAVIEDNQMECISIRVDNLKFLPERAYADEL